MYSSVLVRAALYDYKNVRGLSFVCMFVCFGFRQGDLKTETVKNLEKYVHKDNRLPVLLNRSDFCNVI